MTEQPVESEQQLTDLDDLPRVTLPAIPTVYGLDDPEEGVISWVVALPGGRAYLILRREEVIVMHTSLEHVVRWWAPRHGADLVLVTTGGAPRRN